MTRDRFLELAEAYGGAVARWPAAEWEAAATLMAAEPEFARQGLVFGVALSGTLSAPTDAPEAVSAAMAGYDDLSETAEGA